MHDMADTPSPGDEERNTGCLKCLSSFVRVVVVAIRVFPHTSGASKYLRNVQPQLLTTKFRLSTQEHFDHVVYALEGVLL